MTGPSQQHGSSDPAHLARLGLLKATSAAAWHDMAPHGAGARAAQDSGVFSLSCHSGNLVAVDRPQSKATSRAGENACPIDRGDIQSCHPPTTMGIAGAMPRKNGAHAAHTPVSIPNSNGAVPSIPSPCASKLVCTWLHLAAVCWRAKPAPCNLAPRSPRTRAILGTPVAMPIGVFPPLHSVSPSSPLCLLHAPHLK